MKIKLRYLVQKKDGWYIPCATLKQAIITHRQIYMEVWANIKVEQTLKGKIKPAGTLNIEIPI